MRRLEHPEHLHEHRLRQLRPAIAAVIGPDEAPSGRRADRGGGSQPGVDNRDEDVPREGSAGLRKREHPNGPRRLRRRVAAKDRRSAGGLRCGCAERGGGERGEKCRNGMSGAAPDHGHEIGAFLAQAEGDPSDEGRFSPWNLVSKVIALGKLLEDLIRVRAAPPLSGNDDAAASIGVGR